MAKESDKANIIITRIRVQPHAKEAFIDWQSKLQALIANFPGFLSLEFIAPCKEQPLWTFIQRFSDFSKAQNWKYSEERKNLFNEWRSNYKIDFEEAFSEEKNFNGVTEVIVTEIDPEKRNLYRDWLAKIHQAEAKVPGYQGMYVQRPLQEEGRYWITFLQFDTAENLDRWLKSPERQEILKELNPLIKAFETHRIISPFAGWFRSIAKMGAIPPVWKQTMLVLLVLFPIVMLEFKFLNPLTSNLNLSLAIFIGNAISVILISWPMMPIAIFLFKWWLNPPIWHSTKINIIGTSILLLIYLLEIFIFWG